MDSHRKVSVKAEITITMENNISLVSTNITNSTRVFIIYIDFVIIREMVRSSGARL
jgi:hypothetical protein